MAQKPRPTITQLKKRAGGKSPDAVQSAVKKYGGRMTSDAWRQGAFSSSPFIPESVRLARRKATGQTPVSSKTSSSPSRSRVTGSGFTSGKYRRNQVASSSATSSSASTSSRSTVVGGAGTGGGRKRVTVKSGDTLSAIAKREGVSLAALKKANRGRAVLDRIYSGSKVIIPKKVKK